MSNNPALMHLTRLIVLALMLGSCEQNAGDTPDPNQVTLQVWAHAGITQGKREGKAEMLIHLMQVKFGAVAQTDIEHIEQCCAAGLHGTPFKG